MCQVLVIPANEDEVGTGPQGRGNSVPRLGRQNDVEVGGDLHALDHRWQGLRFDGRQVGKELINIRAANATAFS
jgi:hypothetical protein